MKSHRHLLYRTLWALAALALTWFALRFFSVTVLSEASLDENEARFITDMVQQDETVLRFDKETVFFVQSARVVDVSNPLPSQYYVTWQCPPKNIVAQLALIRPYARCYRWTSCFRLVDFRILQFESWSGPNEVVFSISDVAISDSWRIDKLRMHKEVASKSHSVYLAKKVGNRWQLEKMSPGCGRVIF